MERRVKERLVGAAVLVAAAIILIPEMLSGPKRTEDAGASSSTDGPMKTFTIDLNRPPGSTSATTVEESAPPPEVAQPEESQAQPSVESTPEQMRADSEPPATNPAANAQASPEPEVRERREREPVPTPPVTPPATRPVATPREPPPTVAAAPAVPTTRGWAVQLGSFSNRATADRMAKEFSGAGQSAFVMPVKSGANTLYRVRLGPYAERSAAESALATIKKRVTNAAVVAHP